MKFIMDFKNNSALGACNPSFGHEAPQVEDRIMLMFESHNCPSIRLTHRDVTEVDPNTFCVHFASPRK
jgi:hypothetical protein